MRTLPRATSWLLFVLTMGLSPSALAQDAKTEASGLFERARTAMKAGDRAVACPLFRKSNELDKRVGTLLNLALCEEESGQLVSALGYGADAKALAEAQRDPRSNVALRRHGELAARIPHLTVVLAASATSATVTWTRADGESDVFPASNFGRQLNVDPGKVTFVVRSSGHADAQIHVIVGEGSSETIELTQGVPLVKPPPVEHDGGGPDTVLILGIGAGVAGLAGVGLGIGFGSVASAKQSDAEPLCDANNFCDPSGIALRDEAISAATVSTAMFVVGAALVATGVTFTIISTASGRSETALQIGPAGASMLMRW